MPARDLSEQLKVKSPCSSSWDAMIGNDQVRFCEHCSLRVHNISQLTPKRVRALMAKTHGRLCVRYQSLPDGLPILKTIPTTLHQIQRRASKIAAGAFTATLTLTNAIAQAGTDKMSYQRVFTHQNGSTVELINLAAAIKGKVLDQHGAVIPGAGVTLGTSEIPYLSGTTTNDAGEYSLEGLQPGTYRLKIEALGFVGHNIVDLVIAANETRSIETTLQVAGIQVEVDVNAQEYEITSVTAGVVMISAAEPLIRAALDDDLQEVEAVLTRENVNLRDRNTHTTALEYAVLNGNREMVQVLLSAGADVKSRNNSKQTVLMLLSEESTADIVWDLINAGAGVNLTDEEGDTALIEVASVKNLPALTALIHAGAKVDTKNKEGKTALMIAASANQVANIRALIRAGADMNARDIEGKTALDYAIENEHDKIVKLLQTYGALTGEKPAENEEP